MLKRTYHYQWTRGAVGLAVALLTLVTLSPTAQADDGQTWVLTEFNSRGVDEVSVQTFADLLAAELSSGGGWSVKRAARSCADVDCAVDTGKSAGGDYTIYGSVSRLGEKTIVTATAVEVATGKTVGSQKMSVNKLGDLDAVAERIAAALRTGEDTDETAQLGALTEEESKAPTRREGDNGVIFGLSAVVPMFDDGFGDGNVGAGVDLGLWFEALDFAIVPRIGVRFDTADEEASYVHVPIEIGANYIFSRGDFAPFVGFGAGLHYLNEDRPVTLRSGGVVTTRTETVLEDDVWAFGANARVGALLFRTYSTRLMVTAEYNLLVGEINDRDNPQSWIFGIGAIF